MQLQRNGVATDVLKGAIAGAAATWVMDRVTTAWYERQSEDVTAHEEQARGDQTAYATAAEKASKALGIELSKEQQQTAGQAVHWLLGMDAGITFALARRRIRGVGRLKGVGFGSLFWLLVDEGLNPLLGLTKGPGAFPWQTHARGLAGHLAFGVTAYAALELLDMVA